MSRQIDYDRPGGVIIKIVNRLNMEVFMYKAEPGVYYTAHGHEAPMELAAEAGYDVARLDKLKNKKLRLVEAAMLIEQDEGLEPMGRVAVYEDQGFKAVALGNGLHIVEDEDGQNLTPATRLSLEQAKRLVEQMAEGKIKQAARAISKSGGRDVPGDLGGGTVRGAEVAPVGQSGPSTGAIAPRALSKKA